MAEVLSALDRNEPVKIFHRGKEKAILIPVGLTHRGKASVRKHPAFGMWKTDQRTQDVPAYARRLRQARIDDF
jgi:hypothetical protein